MVIRSRELIQDTTSERMESYVLKFLLLVFIIDNS